MSWLCIMLLVGMIQALVAGIRKKDFELIKSALIWLGLIAAACLYFWFAHAMHISVGGGGDDYNDQGRRPASTNNDLPKLNDL